MIATLRLEAINYARASASGRAPAFLKTAKPRCWVAQITGYDSRYGYKREFVSPSKMDFSQANSAKSRGVYAIYKLEPGVYEVSDPQSWQRTERYFVKVDAGQAQRISEDELRRWMSINDFLRG